MRFVVPFLVILVFTGCRSDNDVEIDFVFSDGFETHSGELGELFPDDNSRWSNIQKVDPSHGTNTVELASEPVSEGARSLRLVASASDNVLSKMDIEKGGFEAPVGSYIVMEMDLFINSDENLADLLLMDLECCACWDPSVADNQCPGIRLMMSGGNDYLAVERGKILGSTIRQNTLAFPRRRWVSIRWEMKLSDEDDGLMSPSGNGRKSPTFRWRL